ncbi:MAG: lysozyme inhibitor LprI family protein [Caulobacteraceae bacterium]
MKRIVVIGALAGLIAAPALAAVDPAKVEARYTKAFSACMNAPGGESTAGMIQCIGAELAIQDARLNAAYKRVMAGLNTRQKTKLQAAQRAWLAFRDADCESKTDEDWGTLSRITANDCMLSRTVERTIELENYPPDAS